VKEIVSSSTDTWKNSGYNYIDEDNDHIGIIDVSQGVNNVAVESKATLSSKETIILGFALCFSNIGSGIAAGLYSVYFLHIKFHHASYRNRDWLDSIFSDSNF